jgi:hypothetical protein
MGEEVVVDVFYALTEADISLEELGRHKKVPLGKALQMVERMLKGSYVMVKLVKLTEKEVRDK